jgi:CheY-like chemotaxis protein
VEDGIMKIRAVVFEDDEFARSMVRRLLDKRGYEVFTFPHPGLCPLSRSDACFCACADILISDVEMPVTNGLEFVEQQVKRGCRVRNIALMSGAWSNANLQYAWRLGCRTFEKPLDVAQLNAWLDECERGIDPDRVLASWTFSPAAGSSAGAVPA